MVPVSDKCTKELYFFERENVRLNNYITHNKWVYVIVVDVVVFYQRSLFLKKNLPLIQ